ERREIAERAGERRHRVAPANSSDDERDHQKSAHHERDERRSFEKRTVRQGREYDAALFHLRARVGGIRPGVRPSAERMAEKRAAFADRKARPATRRERDEHSEALLHVVPAHEKKHELNEPTER